MDTETGRIYSERNHAAEEFKRLLQQDNIVEVSEMVARQQRAGQIALARAQDRSKAKRHRGSRSRY